MGKRLAGLALCAAIAFAAFIVTRSIFDPADMPQEGKAGMPLVDSLTAQSGRVTKAKAQDHFAAAPANKEQIPALLAQLFSEDSVSSEVSSHRRFMSYRLLQNGFTFSMKSKQVDVYAFPLVPDSYVVTSADDDKSLILSMRSESGAWKIDNIIPQIQYDVLSEMELTNWDCKPVYSY